MAKTKNQEVGEKRRSPEWVQSVKDFLKMVFVSPFALIARIAQRIALGKEGAQKADEMAEAAYKASNERRAAEKIADRMNREVSQILEQKNKSPEYSQDPLNIKSCQIYIPDNGRNDLQYAIDIHCQNQTEYNHSRDFALYVDKDGELVCNKGVPVEIIKQVEELLDQIKLTQRSASVEAQPESEQPYEPEPPTEMATNIEQPIPTIPQITDELSKDDTRKIKGTYGDSTVEVTVSSNETSALIKYTKCGREYEIIADCVHNGIRLSGTECDTLKSISQSDYVLFCDAVTAAFPHIKLMNSSKSNPKAAILESIVQELSNTAQSGMPSASDRMDMHRIYIIPDTFAQRNVVITVDNTANNFYINTGYLDPENGFTMCTPVGFSQNIQPIKTEHKMNTDTQIANIIDKHTRKLAGDYLYAAGYEGTPFLQGEAKENRTLYAGQKGDNTYSTASIQEVGGDALIVRSDVEISDKALATFSTVRPINSIPSPQQEEGIRKVANALLTSSPDTSHVYGIVGNVIVQVKDNQLIGQLAGYPESPCIQSLPSESEMQPALQNITQLLEQRLIDFVNEANRDISQFDTYDEPNVE